MEEQLIAWLNENKTTDIVDALASDPALLEARNKDGVSLFLLSFYYRNTVLSDYLATHKHDLDIFEASAAGKLERVTELLRSGPALVKAFSADGFTALGLACFFDRVAVAKHLLEAGADPNIPSRNAFTVAPLHSAAAARSTEIVALLLGHHADPNARQQANFTALHEAANQGNTDMATLLLHYGADASAKADNGKTPYDMAIEKGHQYVAALLRA